MDLVSACPLRVGSILWQPRPDAWMLTVVCKATYTLLPVESPLAGEQDPPNETETHWNDDERLSLRAASDLAPFKRRADVFLVGHAHAPRIQPVSSLVARLLVGDVNKAIEVHADRAWTQDGQLREGPPFATMPLRYERAGGGPETSNPAGIRAGARPDRYGQVAVPNLQPPGFPVTRPGTVIPPIGFGPIAPRWPDRAAKLYWHAAGWDHRTWMERPLPVDIDAAFFNAAPPDQQVGELRSREQIMMENLHPDHPRLVTRLSGISPRAAVERAGAAAQELRLRCDTLCIDTDRGVCNLVWRGQVALGWRDEPGRVVITAKEPGRSGAYEININKEGLGTTVAGSAPVRDALPFSKPDRDASAPARVVAAPPPPPPAQIPSFEPWPEARPAPWMEPDPTPPKEAPPPPPRIGPLARWESAPSLSNAPVAAAGEVPVAATAVIEPEPEQADLPIERFSAISAEIVEGQAARAEVLRRHALTERAWVANEQRWTKALDAERATGSSRLRAASDRAYVEAVEGFRGPITLPEYARIAIGLERGQANPVLDDLKIQRPALMRIVRLWTKKVATDARLAEEARALLSGMRSS